MNQIRSTTNRLLLAATACILAGAATTATADILNVPADQPTIQAGIDAAVDGDEVVVAQGTYVENINFLGKAITVRSTDPTDSVVVLNTIIDGGGANSVVLCNNDEGPDTVLSGFVITNGSASEGGGMQNSNSSPTVTSCSFIGNAAWGNGGGGMYNSFSSPTVTNCSFSGNEAAEAGGGMFNNSSSPTVTNCMFSGNTSGSDGAGMYNLFSSPTVTNCSFSGNSAWDGGGMANSPGSSPTVSNTEFCGNLPDAIFGSYTDGGGNSLEFCALPAAPPADPDDTCPADITGDGIIDQADLGSLLAVYGNSCP